MVYHQWVTIHALLPHPPIQEAPKPEFLVPLEKPEVTQGREVLCAKASSLSLFFNLYCKQHLKSLAVLLIEKVEFDR